MKSRLFTLLALMLLQAGTARAQAPSLELIQQRRLDIAPGQYSGIAHVGEDVYAVVHDKALGGGLFFFTLSFLPDGSIGAVSAFETDAGGPQGRDNEDVVYVRETGTLFVASEADQSIREYSLDGRETGRQLRVPQELKTCRHNLGFEALAYSEGLFWTTTEAPLPGEDFHRLQSFKCSTLAPARQYKYMADNPSASAEGTQAYVHGISAMTALPDGRLIVMEREVCVPSGSFRDMLGAFTLTKLYLIDPLHDKKSPLQKVPLGCFSTSALNLANFEGMCLGPVLQDGRQTLLLLADSQDGSKGLTAEYIRVMALDIR